MHVAGGLIYSYGSK